MQRPGPCGFERVPGRGVPAPSLQHLGEDRGTCHGGTSAKIGFWRNFIPEREICGSQGGKFVSGGPQDATLPGVATTTILHCCLLDQDSKQDGLSKQLLTRIIWKKTLYRF